MIASASALAARQLSRAVGAPVDDRLQFRLCKSVARSVLGKFGQEHRKAFPRETTPDFGSERGEEFLVTKSERAQRQWRQIIEQVDADDDIVISFGHVGEAIALRAAAGVSRRKG